MARNTYFDVYLIPWHKVTVDVASMIDLFDFYEPVYLADIPAHLDVRQFRLLPIHEGVKETNYIGEDIVDELIDNQQPIIVFGPNNVLLMVQEKFDAGKVVAAARVALRLIYEKEKRKDVVSSYYLQDCPEENAVVYVSADKSLLLN